VRADAAIYYSHTFFPPELMFINQLYLVNPRNFLNISYILKSQ